MATAALFTSVNADGWSATYSSPPTFDPVGDPEFFTVYRDGFDDTGTAVTVEEDLVCMARIRQAYPNQASLTTDQVALSDFIYASDTIEGGATNNSTRAYPVPGALWLQHDLDVCTGDTYTARLAVAHAHARNGRPVAAVKFILTDGTNTTETLVSTMTPVAYDASGLTVPAFEGVLDTSGLTQGALATLDVIVYPWVGEEFQASVDGSTYPSVNFSTLRVLIDRTGAYGAAYAYVDPVSGNNGTAVVSANPATAAASPYLNFSNACIAIKTFNNTTYGRNNTAGGIVRLVEGTTPLNASISTATSGDVPLIVEAADPTKRDTTILSDNGSGRKIGWFPQKMKFRSITIQKTVNATYEIIDQAAVLDSPVVCIFEDVNWANTSGSSMGLSVTRTGRTWMIDCRGVNFGQADQFSAINKQIIAIGSAAGCLGSNTNIYHAAGCKTNGEAFGFNAGNATRPAAVAPFCAYNFLRTSAVATPMSMGAANTGARGGFYIGNVVERFGSNTGPTAQFYSDALTGTVENLVVMGNTFVGERVNWLYDDLASTTLRSGYFRFNVADEFNIKGDVFKLSGSHVGNFSERYKVANHFNAILRASDSGEAVGTGSWLGDILGIGEATGTDASPLDADWVLDASRTGTSAGDGDYTPGASTALPILTSGLEPWSHDLFGTVIASGTMYAGAVAVEATVSATADTDAGSVTVAGSAATAGAGATASPTAGAVTVAGAGASAGAGATATPPAGAVAAAGVAPTTAAGALASPGAGAVTVAGAAPTVTAGVLAETAAGVVSVVGQAPTVSAGGTVTAAPAAGVVTVAGATPQASAGATASPGAGGVTVVGTAPTISAGATVSPGAGAVTVVGSAPVALGATPSPTPAWRTTAVAAQEPRLAVTVSPGDRSAAAAAETRLATVTI